MKTILIDLDGVLNTYKGEYDKNYIPPLLKGAKDFLEILSEFYEIKIFTSRNVVQTKKWIIDNNIDKYISNVTNIKEPAYLYIDDRSINFKSDFGELLKEIKNFKAWYKD